MDDPSLKDSKAFEGAARSEPDRQRQLHGFFLSRVPINELL